METTTKAKPRLTMTKKEFFDSFKFDNELELKNRLNEIIFENRKEMSLYKGFTRKKIIDTKHIKRIEWQKLLEENTIDPNYFA